MSEEKEYQITHAWEGDILVITLTGQATARTSDEIVREVYRILGELQPKYVLHDCRNIRGRSSAGETYQRMRRQPPRLPFVIKRAILDLEENRAYQSFHETAAANLGIELRFFTDHDEAVAWLHAPESNGFTTR